MESDSFSPIGLILQEDGNIAGSAARAIPPIAFGDSSSGPLGDWITTVNVNGASYTPTPGGRVVVTVSFTGWSSGPPDTEDFNVRIIDTVSGFVVGSGSTLMLFNESEHLTLPTVYIDAGVPDAANRCQIQVQAGSTGAEVDTLDYLGFMVMQFFPGSSFVIGS